MKKRMALALLLSSPFVLADSVNDELYSAQAAYRTALRAQSSSSGRVATLQTDIAAAQARIQQAQADIARMQQELQEETAKKAQADSALQAAGQRLNAAWQAAHAAGR
ncbi:hypothetical protein [Neisseria zalophi]|uniref:Periplasmic protein n=1 Tax=Neisseria zalophi TaxID=640030 RepID=A0A5J6PRZ7_9NEIS|nr:hypothetical protein [Neisseria zalophi]QEY25136.1 hypothetical protein D0T92_00295 [Neisseria zalophi]